LATLGKTSAVAACLVGLLSAATACAGSARSGDGPDRQEESSMADTTITAAQKELTDSIITKPGVVGTAIGLCDDTPCIKVYLAERNEELLELIPDTFKGFKVDVEVTGEVRARDTTG
jgi:hypothetical protein